MAFRIRHETRDYTVEERTCRGQFPDVWEEVILMKKLVVVLVALGVSCLFLWSSTAQENYRIIVNSENPATSASKADISNLLLKKKTRWDGGASADPVDLGGDSPVREAFSRDIHGRSVTSIKNYWQRQIFSGRDVPPPEVASDADVVAFVASRPGGIGYVSANARLRGVKAVTVAN